MIVGRHNALEVEAGRAYRFRIYSCVIREGSIVDADISPAYVDAFDLPVTREQATAYAWEFFEDLGNEGVNEIVSLLTRPTGPLV